MGCLRRDPTASGGTTLCVAWLAKIGRGEARPFAMKSSGILRGRDSLRYFDGELEGGGSMRAGDFGLATGKRAIDEGSELLPERLFFFNRDRVARDLPVDPAVNFAALSLIIEPDVVVLLAHAVFAHS